jgi:hypothetical protein
MRKGEIYGTGNNFGIHKKEFIPRKRENYSGLSASGIQRRKLFLCMQFM